MQPGFQKETAPQPVAQEEARRSRLLLDQFADKWTMLVLRAFCPGDESIRFNELRRRVGAISQKTLTQCLRNLEGNGIVSREVIAAKPLGVAYAITELGLTLQEPLRVLSQWISDHGDEVLQSQKRFDSVPAIASVVAVRAE